MIQHEVDHLDGVLMLDRTERDQKRAALRALREGGTYAPERPRRRRRKRLSRGVRTVYLGTTEFAATVLRRLADSPHRPALVVTPPDSRRGGGASSRRRPRREAARELGLDLHQTADVNSAWVAGGDPRRGPRGHPRSAPSAS